MEPVSLEEMQIDSRLPKITPECTEEERRWQWGLEKGSRYNAIARVQVTSSKSLNPSKSSSEGAKEDLQEVNTIS